MRPDGRLVVYYSRHVGPAMHYTNAHPTEFPDVNIYYARVRDGKIERVGGQQIGSLDDPIAPAEGDLIYDGAERRAG